MTKEIAFIMPYFGSFKPSFSLWLESVRRNPEICWVIVTDNCEPEDKPKNVIWVNSTLQEVQELAEKELGCTVRLDRPYKLCDLKPLYGAVFKKYINEYEYWGYGDLDVIYGRLYYFLQKIDYKKFDKINRWGHCTLIKNNDEMNRLPFSEEGKESFDIYHMLRDGKKNYGYDEIQHNEICWNMGLNVYVNRFQADIDIFYERMRCVDRRTMEKFCKVKNVTYAPENFPYQVFVSDHGKTVRLYLKGKKVLQEEFAYIHYRQEASIELSDQKTGTFVISRYGFFDCDPDKLDDYDYVKSLIKQYNSQTAAVTERLTGTALGEYLTGIYKDNAFLKSIWRKIKG